MGESLGVASLILEADTSKLERDMQAAHAKAAAGGSKASAGFGARFAGGVKKATVPAVAALGALALGSKKAIDAASNLEEAQSAANTTFGKSAYLINHFASSAKDSFTKADFLGAAKTFAVFGKAAGKSGEDLAVFSSKLVFAAQDMASFHNADPSEVLENVRAGLAGETEPLRKYGILMNEAALNEFAWKNGIAKRGKELSEKEKVLARQGFILANLGDAQGDYERTANSTANTERRNAANMEDTTAKIGQGLLPAYQGLQRVLAFVTGLMANHADVVRIVAGVVAILAASVLVARGAMAVWRAGVIVATAAQWLFNAALTANPIGLVVLALVALGVALVVAYKKSETFRKIVHAAIDFVRAHWMKLLFAFGLLPGIIVLIIRNFGKIKSFVGGVWDWIRTKASSAWGAVRGTINQFVAWVGGIPGRIKSKLSSMWDGVASGFRSAWNAVAGFLNGLNVTIDVPDILPGPDSYTIGVQGVPYMDDGGIMPGPRGRHSLAWVAGGETILPTHKPGFRGMGEVHLHFPRYAGSRRELVADIKRGLDEYRRQNGGADPW